MQSSNAYASENPIRVLESTALVEWFKRPDTPFTLKSLKRLHAEQPVAIPDMVLFEMTDYLPNYQAPLLGELQAAREAGEEALTACVKKHVRQSPLAKGDHNKASQIEVLLRFIADHPDTLQSTYVGRHYSRYTDTQIALPLPNEQGEPQETATPSDAYILTKGDAAHLTDGAFNVRSLRVHISDLLQMGYMKTKDYVQLESKEEKASALRKRFVTSSDFLKRLDPAPPSSTLRALESRLVPKRGKTKHYLTFGDLETEINGKQSLLPGRAKITYAYSEEPTERILLQEMVQHTGLLVEHLFYGGMLPEALIPIIAQNIGFSAQGDEPYPETKDTLGETLKQEGFFERRVSLGLIKQIKTIVEGMNASEIEGVDASAVERSIEYLTQLSNVEKLITLRRDVLSECTKNRSTSSMGLKAFDPERGTAYEHLFTDALFSGMLSVEEFVSLATHAEALPNRQAFGNEDMLIGLSDSSLFYSQDEHLLLIEKPSHNHSGATTRAGPITPLAERDDLHPRELTFDNRNYAAYPIDQLLHIATSFKDPDAKQCRRFFRAMLYPAIEQNAMEFRDKAQTFFSDRSKEALLPQLEHHWLRMHKRHWGGPENGSAPNEAKRGHTMPFFTSPFASLYAQREAVKKNLGEMAAAEVAHDIAQEGGKVAIINHDNALQSDAESRRFTGFNPEHTRQMSRFRSPCHAHANGTFHLTTLEKRMKDLPITIVPSRELTSRVAALQGPSQFVAGDAPNAADSIISDAIALGSLSLTSKSVQLAS